MSLDKKVAKVQAAAEKALAKADSAKGKKAEKLTKAAEAHAAKAAKFLEKKAAKASKKSHKGLLFCGMVLAAGVAGFAAYKASRPVEDPWKTPGA